MRRARAKKRTLLLVREWRGTYRAGGKVQRETTEAYTRKSAVHQFKSKLVKRGIPVSSLKVHRTRKRFYKA